MPARVLWCNFELARRLGFSVPRANRLDDRLERELVKAFSLRAPRAGQHVPANRCATLYADRYFGSGMGDHLGSARGGILMPLDVFIKGLGRTPLAGAGNPRHSNGECHLLQCVAETVFGELDAHLFAAGATRVVALLDQGRTVEIDGKRHRTAIVVRVGAPFRPAHLVRRTGEDLRDLPRLFVRLARLGGVLVTRGHRPDFAETMRRIMRLQARTAAEQVRWRVLHGAISTSNVGLFGEMIDLCSQSTQARTAPVSIQRGRRTRSGSFGGEHAARGQELHLMYLSITDSLSPRRRRELGASALDCAAEFQTMYMEELDIQLLRATGFRAEMAQGIQRLHPELVRRYCTVLQNLMAFRNPGPLNIRRFKCEDVGVVDVFRVLALLPPAFLRAPDADHRNLMRALADLKVSGEPSRRGRVRTRATKALDELLELYRALMRSARRLSRHLPGGWKATRNSICERAKFENQPLRDFYRAWFLAEISALEHIVNTRDGVHSRTLQDFIDTRIARNARNIDSMLAGGATSDPSGTTFQRRVLDDVEHALRSRDGKVWHIEVSVGGPALPRYFHFSFDGSSWRSVPVRQFGRRARATIRPAARFGVLEGGFSNDRTMPEVLEKVTPFAFALP